MKLNVQYAVCRLGLFLQGINNKSEKISCLMQNKT